MSFKIGKTDFIPPPLTIVSWTGVLGQSFNQLAVRAHTNLVRSPPDIASEKIEAYEAMWGLAASLS